MRRTLWLNILEDLGPEPGCILPVWLRCVYAVLFPLQALRYFIDSKAGFDLMTCCWRIHGVMYSDALFACMAIGDGRTLYRFAQKNGVVTIERVEQGAP